ncbi:K(+)/H(+) antiporter 1 [Ceratocystis fimbriata CBS 114723]|uniref:K(+)/H(+) antiporter 1 n=1 Tax=Ceratocystis fimbriata CBS 114723 TaxID=1035309 RepID=A0A2C5WVZ2_9PEZI|nr:K(+)/H(+) antiporter 1 [Ceratocystis fimbriata CBS 114723]
MSITDNISNSLVRRAARAQAGILEGMDPTDYDPSNPIILFIIQACIIIVFCRLLHYPLSLLGQPRVIAEVIGGIVLGPSVMMRIPNFKETIFPTASMPVLNNVANLGLVIFLFLVALEIDLRMFRQNWRLAAGVGVASMMLPFGLGVAIAWGLYNEFRSGTNLEDIGFGTYALFIGTALAITAFPVLCRILTELKLLHANVGVTALAAGVANDVTGWILLALCVALANNSSGLAALWALLCTIGWTLFLTLIVRPIFIWYLRKTGSLQNGPTQGIVALTMLLVLASAFFTAIIGVHAIFGAFLVGVICPHDGGFAVKMTEKIEDLISVLFLPLYFALSGLNTNLGLLNSGIAWAYVVGVLAVAFTGKIVGGTLAARFFKLEWRESLTIGVLMSCKGLVELIVLNIGLQAKILNEQTFTIFVVMAVITTVSTTPLTKLLYPPSYQRAIEGWRRGETDKKGRPLLQSGPSSQANASSALRTDMVHRLMVHLRLDTLSSLFTFVSLLEIEDVKTNGVDAENEAKTGHADPAAESNIETPGDSTNVQTHRHLEVHGLRLLELTDRTSSVMQSTEGDEYGVSDPVVTAFSTFSRLNEVAAAGRVAIVPASSFSETLVHHASSISSDFVIIPWSQRGSLTEDQGSTMPSEISSFQGRGYSEFVQETLRHAPCPTAIFMDKGFGGGNKGLPTRPPMSRTASVHSTRTRKDPIALPVKDKSHVVFFPFFGGADDRVALRFVMQLSKKANVTATIAHFKFTDEESLSVDGEIDKTAAYEAHASSNSSQHSSSVDDHYLLSSLQSNLASLGGGRVAFTEIPVTRQNAIAIALQTAQTIVGQNPRNAGDLIIVGRSHSCLNDGATDIGDELKSTLGQAASSLLGAHANASVLVVQDTRLTSE